MSTPLRSAVRVIPRSSKRRRARSSRLEGLRRVTWTRISPELLFSASAIAPTIRSESSFEKKWRMSYQPPEEATPSAAATRPTPPSAPAAHPSPAPAPAPPSAAAVGPPPGEAQQRDEEEEQQEEKRRDAPGERASAPAGGGGNGG